MKRIAALIGQELKWVQPNTFKMVYELRAGDETAATLRFKSSFGTFATAESADGCWTFKRTGFFQTRVTIRACGEETDFAFFINNTWKGGGTLELPDGRKFPASTNFWATKYEFTTEPGEVLFRYRKIGGVLHLSAQVEIMPAAVSIREIPWMVMLGWYLVVMIHMDQAAVAAAT